jgi:hypothetical protein
VERVFSHYLWRLTSPRGREARSLADAIRLNPVYVDTSSYYSQIKQYLKVIQSARIQVILLEDLIENPRATLERVFEFLEVDRAFEPPNLNVSYNAIKDRTTMVAPFLRRLTQTSWYPHGPWQIRHGLRRRLRVQTYTRADLFTPQTYNHLHQLLRDDVARLKDYLKRDLPWDFPRSKYS